MTFVIATGWSAVLFGSPLLRHRRDRVDDVHAGRHVATKHRVRSAAGCASVSTMKNWLPFVLGPEFAIATVPRVY